MTHPNQVVREGALRILYGLDVGGVKQGQDLSGDIDRGLGLLTEVWSEAGERRGDITARVESLLDVWDDLTDEVQAVSTNWRVERMAVIDRNILRMGCWEIEYGDEPPAVVIDASVELGKTFGATETSGFVNGLLEEFCSRRDIAMTS